MFRNQHNIEVFSAGKERPWLTMEEVATQLGVSVAVVRTMVKTGKLPARQITPGVPWMIERHELARPEVTARVHDAKLGRRTPREDARQITMPCL
jgi:excisionase family DNA binding protein